MEEDGADDFELDKISTQFLVLLYAVYRGVLLESSGNTRVRRLFSIAHPNERYFFRNI
jgi:hypothetical protein